ncbi:MAG: hypothetical protein Q4D29_05485 [Lachnospiraceae bacterium]|nr:hypothetical protein [Lachnospiraceae bacterium]
MLDKVKQLRFSFLYFSLAYLCYVLTVIDVHIRTGVFASLLLVAIIIEIGLCIIKSGKKSDFISLLNISVFAYFSYNFLSFIWILKNGYPISIYVEEFSNSILPIVFYFVATIVCSDDDCLKANSDEKNMTDKIYKFFMYSFLVLSILCIILYLWAPQFYCDYLFNMGYISKADASTVHVRMEGFTGSTIISYLAVAAMIVAAKYMYESYEKAGLSKGLAGLSALFIFFFAVVFLANGRAGMVAAILVIVYLNFLVFFSFKFLDKKYLYIELAIIGILIVAMCVATPGIAHKIWARLVSLPGAVGQRSEQWISAINNMPAAWYGQWFGNGLGANGHKAIGIEGAHIVADGGLVKLYCEEGAIGFALYVYIMLVIFRFAFKNLKKYFAEVAIIGTAILMSIGSNIIAFQLCLPIIWFAAGVIGRDVINKNERDK